MKIKRFYAADMRQALRKIRDEQGADAVILSSRRVDGGIEIVAAGDYDQGLVSQMAEAVAPPAGQTAVSTEPVATANGGPAAELPGPTVGAALAPIIWAQDPAIAGMRQELTTLRALLERQLARLGWGDVLGRDPARARLVRRLDRLGLSADLAAEVADQVRHLQHPDHAWRAALALLAGRLAVTDDDILSDGGVVALVGPTGVGKTTTMAKLAARYALRHGRRQVALVNTDCYRIGAQEQLLTFGELLGIPVHTARNAGELGSVLDQLADKRLVLIDNPGLGRRELDGVPLRDTLRVRPGIRTYLVLAANHQRAGLDETVQAYAAARPQGCILTKLDEATSLGEAISVVIQRRVPVAYLGDGQRVPEDLRPARPESLVSRAALMLGPEPDSAAPELPAALGTAPVAA
jgi:flagellar biosynthesis protein FlhF